MLGRKDYTKEELDHAQTAIRKQLAAYNKLVTSIEASKDAKATAALEEFASLFFNNLALVLDRYFVHRLRGVTGKDGNPINELELLSESLMNNDGVLRGNTVIKYVPEESVTNLKIGDRIRLTQTEFEQLTKAFFADLKAKYVH